MRSRILAHCPARSSLSVSVPPLRLSLSRVSVGGGKSMAEVSAATPHPAPPASEGAVLLEAGRVPVESAVSPHVLGRVAARFVLCPSGKRSVICDGGRHVRRWRDRSVLTLCFLWFLCLNRPHMLVCVVWWWWHAAHEHEIVCSARALTFLLLILSLNQMWFDCVRPVGVVWWILGGALFWGCLGSSFCSFRWTAALRFGRALICSVR
jgi:hypothetical protein